jgi:hypothetical protein
MFGGQAIVHRDDHRSRASCDGAADHVVGIQVADHPAASMKIAQGRLR